MREGILLLLGRISSVEMRWDSQAKMATEV